MRAGGWIPRHQRLRRGPCRCAGGTRDLTYHVAWERTPNDVSQTSRCRRCRSSIAERRADAHLDQVVAMRGRPNWRRALRAADDLAAAQLARGLREMGVTSGTDF